mmetsp:Transcript_15850/g.41988  ORF Transcript_15850/g.41988 Transcript_15850/m.41988 type:complete len:332 (+) Transcript_15850:691-1686(+)
MGKPALVQELSRAVGVPNLHALLGQVVGVRVALHKPQQLLEDAAPERPLRRQQWEALPEVEAHLLTKHRSGAHSGALVGWHALLDDLTNGVEVLVLLVQQLPCTAHGSQRWRRVLFHGRHSFLLVHDKIVRQAVVTGRLAQMYHLELGGIERWEECIAIEVLADACHEDIAAVGQLDRLLVRGLASDHEYVGHILALRKLIDGVRDRRCHQHARRIAPLGRLVSNGARQHYIEPPGKRPKLARDRLPRLAAHDDGVELARAHVIRQSPRDPLEVRHVLGQAPRQGTISANASPRRARHDDGHGTHGCPSHDARARERPREQSQILKQSKTT